MKHFPVYGKSSSQAAQPFTLHLLGPPTIALDHETLDIPRRSVRALFYRLACEPGPVTRAHLHLLFWPEVPEVVARRNLTHHLTHLRLAAPMLNIQADQNNWVRLDPAQVWCDVVALRCEIPHSPVDTSVYRSLAALYRGHFLEGFDLPGHPGFEHWCIQERGSLERRYLAVLEQLVERLTLSQETQQAIEYAQRYLRIDPLAEVIHQRLMQLYTATGARHLAMRQFELFRAALKVELGVNPLPQTIALYQALKGGQDLLPDS